MTNTNRNAPLLAGNDALDKKSKEPNQLLNLNSKVLDFQYKNNVQSKFSPHITAFVCDECSIPLHLGGENFIESYSNGRANILRCLCDTHARAFGFLEVK